MCSFRILLFCPVIMVVFTMLPPWNQVVLCSLTTWKTRGVKLVLHCALSVPTFMFKYMSKSVNVFKEWNIAFIHTHFTFTETVMVQNHSKISDPLSGHWMPHWTLFVMTSLLQDLHLHTHCCHQTLWEQADCLGILSRTVTQQSCYCNQNFVLT